MILNTSKIKNGQVIEFENKKLELDQSLFETYFVKLTSCLVSGYIKKIDYSVEIKLNIKSEFSGLCYKCGEEAKFDLNLSLNNNLDLLDNSTVIKNRELDMEALVSEELLLNLPSKVVCRESCLGLCGTCGNNLNYQSCDCAKAITNNANNPFNELKKLLNK